MVSATREHVDYFILATVTRDVGTDGASPSAARARSRACMAQALGQRVGLASRFAARRRLPRRSPASAVAREAAACTTAFENRYEAHGRVQVLHERAGELSLAATPPGVAARADRASRTAGAGHRPARGRALSRTRWSASRRRVGCGAGTQRGQVDACAWAERETGAGARRCDRAQHRRRRRRLDADRGAGRSARALLVVTEAEHGATVFHAGERRRFAAPRVARARADRRRRSVRGRVLHRLRRRAATRGPRPSAACG